MGIILAILIISFIIIFHELGHFLLAKANGIRVDEFSLGLGPTLIGVQIGGTRFCLKLLPFGGACMMGEDDADDMSEGSFNSKPVWARISVIAAGPVFNLILAWIFCVILISAAGYRPAELSDVSEGYSAQEHELKDRLRIDTDWYSKQKEEVYRKRVDRITAFRKQWLESADLQAYGLHFGTEWKDVGRECVRTVPPVARQLSFGNGTGIEPSCIKLYRPFSGVPNKQYRFIFIYQSGNEALHAMLKRLYYYFAYGSPDGNAIVRLSRLVSPP